MNSLKPDTQAILLLCGQFSKKSEIQPLTFAEYAWLSQWLQDQHLRPANLLETSVALKLKHLEHEKITPDRLLTLLMRGAALALAVELWTSKGLWVISRSDQTYPTRLKTRLGQAAPPLLYGIGPAFLLQKRGIAMVGSRNIDDPALDFTKKLAKLSAQQGLTIISGGARGVDTQARLTALAQGRCAVGVLADSLAKTAVTGKYREVLREERLVLISPFDPNASFNIGNTIACNKYIYTLADWVVVVNCHYQEGGTWAGAIENLKTQWVPLLVRQDATSMGNQQLIKQGATPIDHTLFQSSLDLAEQFERLVGNLVVEQTPPPKTPQLPEKIDLFEIIWPHLEKQLLIEKTEEELIELLNLHPKQLKIWLNRALELGKLVKLTKPVRYVSTLSHPQKQTALF